MTEQSRDRDIDPREALEAGIPLEVLMMEGILEEEPLEKQRLRKQIQEDTVREGEELKAELQRSLNSPDSIVRDDLF